MVGLDGVLSVAACATAVIASLQAGSRAKHLLENHAIGVKRGPLILPPTGNETSALWELVQVFQRSVELGLMYDLDADRHGFVRQASSYEQLDAAKVEPYSLSPFPRSLKEKEWQDHLLDMYIETATSTQEKESFFFHRILQGHSVAMTKLSQVANWLPKGWNRRTRGDDLGQTLPEDSGDDDEDFSQCLSKKIRLSGTDTMTAFEVAQITAYAPKAFARLRSHFKISEASFRRSLFESGAYISFNSNSKGAARSGGVFFFTRDGAYMIKTIKTGEAQTFLQILPKYYNHMKYNKRRSLLTRFCGMYTVKLGNVTTRAGMNSEEQYTFVIMNSVFPAEASGFMSQMYDLKGSTVGRECSEEEKLTKGPNAVLKDLDLAREVALVRAGQKERSGSRSLGIQLGASAKSELLAQLRKDIDLLRGCGVMDYSLLVGVVNMDQRRGDTSDWNASELRNNKEKLFLLTESKKNPAIVLARTIGIPLKLLMAPPLFFIRKTWHGFLRIVSSVMTYPLPYFGSSVCVVDGGKLSVMYGRRYGQRAIYYLGLIDFLQPWTARKIAEKQLKGFLGYDTEAISCVDPDKYASRFLDFVEAHVT